MDFDNRGRNVDGIRDNQNWGRQADGGNNGRREDENRRGDRRWDGAGSARFEPWQRKQKRWWRGYDGQPRS